MPTTTTKPETTGTGSAEIAANIDDTQAAIALLQQQQTELIGDLNRQEAALSQQQAAFTEAREAEVAEAREAELSENLKALKAKAQALNEASAALAELWPEFKADHQRYINALPPAQQQQFYSMGVRTLETSALPFVITEKGSSRIRISSLGQQPKQ